MNLLRSLGSVGGLTLVSRVLALGRDTLQATYVGAGFASDAFFVAFRLPNMFRALFAEGAFSAAFIPMFNRKVAEEGGTRSEEHTSELQSLMRISYAVFCLTQKSKESTRNRMRLRTNSKTVPPS